MFLSGHLQLLQAQLGSDGDADLRSQFQAALEGTQRIQKSVDRIRMVSRAALGPRTREPVAIDQILQQALTPDDANGDAEPKAVPAVVREPEAGPFRVSGERQVLEQAIGLFARVGRELHGFFGDVHFELTRVDAAIRLRLLAAGPAVDVKADEPAAEEAEPFGQLQAQADWENAP